MSKISVSCFSEDLVKRTADEALIINPDISRVQIVFPSKRFGFFLKEEFKRRIEGTVILPVMQTIDEFVAKIYIMSSPGFAISDDIQSSYFLYQAVREIFGGKNLYAGEKDLGDFLSFYPWAQKIKSGIEEILVESEKIPDQTNVYEKFTSLGEYNEGYRDFITKLPDIAESYMKKHEENKMFTRGMAYRKIKTYDEDGFYAGLNAGSFIFSGFYALNPCEKRLIRSILKNFDNSLFLLRAEKRDKNSSLSPFRTAFETLREIGGDHLESSVLSASDLSCKTQIYPCSNSEHEMIQIYDCLSEYLRDNKNADPKKIGVLLPDPAGLMPFVNNVISRFEKESVNFNVTLSYPFQRTPLFQLIDFLLKISENHRENKIPAQLYLQMLKHPYLKLSANSKHDIDLRKEMHGLETAIIENNILNLETDGEGGFKNKGLPQKVSEELKRINQTFLPSKAENAEELCRRISKCIDIIYDSEKNYLFFRDFINSAKEAILELEEFFKRNPGAGKDPRAPGKESFIRQKLSLVPVRFVGSPLEGIQVMGALEFRNLSFEAVFIADCVEGVMPDVTKYDPLLPGDIKELFSMRRYGDWESIYAFNFYSILSSARIVKIFYPEKSGGRIVKRSRFIESLVHESRGKKDLIMRKSLKFSLGSAGKIPGVEKTKKIKEIIIEKGLSPTSFEDYLSCPMKFYYKKTLGLEEKVSLDENPDASAVGTVVHEALCRYYRDKSLDIGEVLYEVLKDKNIVSDQGTAKIKFWGIKRMLEEFVLWDNEKNKDIRIVSLEEKISRKFELDGVAVPFHGKIDRVEEIGQEIFICDYKTKEKQDLFNSKNYKFDELSVPDFANISDEEYKTEFPKLLETCGCYQVLIYMKMWAEDGNKKIQGINGKYYLLRTKEEKEKVVFTGEKKVIYWDKFQEIFQSVMRDILFNPLFIALPSEKSCKYCPFKNLCGV